MAGFRYGARIPSKSIEDIKLPEDAYKVDFELSKRYAEFAKEITRFSLLGIAGYGFLVEKIVGAEHIPEMARGITLTLVIVGLSCLVSSAGLGLYCGQLNKACLLMQVAILRLLQRGQSDRWTNSALSSAAEVETSRAANLDNLQTLRKGQAENLTRAHKVQQATIGILILGVIATAGVFLRCLYLNIHQGPSMPMPAHLN